MKLRHLSVLALLPLVGGCSATSSVGSTSLVSSSCAHQTRTGTIGGANYKIEVPANWNGTLALYSHGYIFAGQPNPTMDVVDPQTGGALLSQGYALAGSSYSAQGWALQQAFQDQLALLDFFDETCGQPTRTIAWGDSLGGMITAGLAQLFPNRFSGALPRCGPLAGGVATWNQALDGAFAFDVLMAGNQLPIVNLDLLTPTQLQNAFGTATGILNTAQNTAQGRARISLAAALVDLPDWFIYTQPEPASTDYAAQEVNQRAMLNQNGFLYTFFGRAELEMRAGGNPSWNTDVNYRTQLERSADFNEVKALYQAAGLNLEQDLDTLNSAPRIAANPNAVKYLNKYLTFNGALDIPVLTMHTTSDGVILNQHEQAYKSAVDEHGDANQLRQIFVHRAGHCTFTPAETVTAFNTLINRLNTGEWGNNTDPSVLNQEAKALGSLNYAPPAFIRFEPTVFLRPYSASEEA